MKPDNIIAKSKLKSLIQEITRQILSEGVFKKTPIKEEREEAFYRDAQDRESLAAQVRKELVMIAKAGLTKEYESLMDGIFSHGIKEFDRRAAALGELKTRAEKIVQQSLGGVDEETGTAAVSPISTPFAFKKQKPLDEMTTTGAVSGYNVPGFLSKRGGSAAGVKGSEKLGYTLTPAGRDEMNRSGDRLLEGKQLNEGIKSVLKRLAQELHIFQSPEMKAEASAVLQDFTNFFKQYPTGGSMKDLQKMLTDVFAKHNVSNERQQSYVNLAFEWRGNKIRQASGGGAEPYPR